MPWTPSEREIAGVSSLEAPERYKHWIKKVADEGEVWSLWHEGGWALALDSEGNELVPVWPHGRYAEVCAKAEWHDYQPRSIPIDVWLGRWIPGMTQDKRLVAVFPTALDRGMAVDPRRVEQDLREEMSGYE